MKTAQNLPLGIFDELNICETISNTKSGLATPRYKLVRAGGLCLCSSDFNRLLKRGL